MKGKTILVLTVATGLALPAISFGQAKTETGTGGGVNENATSTRAQTTSTDNDADTATSTKTKKKTTMVHQSRKNRSQITGTEPTNTTTQSNTTGDANAAKGNFPTTREPGHRKTMNGLGKRDSLQDTGTGTNMDPGTGH